MPWGWAAERWPEEAQQEIAILIWLYGAPTRAQIICALEKLARQLGWTRARPDLKKTKRKWVPTEQWIIYRQAQPGYRHSKKKEIRK